MKKLKFDKTTATAIDKSIVKWERVLKGAVEHGAVDCALCTLFNNDDTATLGTDCRDCPIAIYVRETKNTCGYGCKKTPYIKWYSVSWKININSIAQASTDPLLLAEMIKAAKAELDFLHEVKTWYHANAQKEETK